MCERWTNMRRVCAWCGKEMDKLELECTTDEPITHGICPDCVRKVLSYGGMPLRRYLDRFSGRVYLVDSSVRIVAANKEGVALTNKTPEEIEGLLGGDAFECAYAHLPGGCGKTVHCKTCTIRNIVTETFCSGRGQRKVAAYPDLYHITGEKITSFLITTEKVGDAVLLGIDESPD